MSGYSQGALQKLAQRLSLEIQTMEKLSEALGLQRQRSSHTWLKGYVERERGYMHIFKTPQGLLKLVGVGLSEKSRSRK
ncbi:hypothetical protein M7I_3616 [Glarea lozoyensis 74030]|uniref:Uncharacterized protein n=1 Tax=Glarea lozoyensis (strain ATCC 74030 / MF5533) TaxID=1104152 RepID=H0ELZ1_GLAL7|nr:hypothetical protein M7I_3616 [Glarea lozoyensis 74030]